MMPEIVEGLNEYVTFMWRDLLCHCGIEDSVFGEYEISHVVLQFFSIINCACQEGER